MSTRIRLAVLDCNAVVREALRRRLVVDSRVSDVVVEGACDRAAVAHLLDSAQPHAVLIDPRAANRAAPKLPELLALREGRPYFVIGVHVTQYDPAEERAALAAGCDLYLLKGHKTALLIDRLYAIVAEQRSR
jgi:DNA-binding NarL/FixJ family response regulator